MIATNPDANEEGALDGITAAKVLDRLHLSQKI